MATQVLSCSHILIGGYQLSGDFNEWMVNHGSAQLDRTTFGTQTRLHKSGLLEPSIEAKGFVNLGSSLLDPVLFANVGGASVLVSIFRHGITEGSTNDGFAMAANQAQYNFGGNVGDLLPFDFSAEADSPLVMAVPVWDARATAWSTDSSGGSAYPISTQGWSTGEQLYAGLHVTAMSTGIAGTSVAVVIQQASSSGAGFTAAATARITFSTLSCSKASEFATPIGTHSTDKPFWRALVTVSTGGSTGANANGLVFVSMK